MSRGAPDGSRTDWPLPAATRYLVCDPRKCTGCRSCMMACSMVHEGRASPVTARILLTEDPFGVYPSDIDLCVCRQCRDASCLTACPTGALTIDPGHFNVRMVDGDLCNGCRKCVGACHFAPSRMRFDPRRKKSTKCDLCRDTPFWSHERGELACVQVCPVHALESTSTPPLGALGYEVDLRGEGWARLGFTSGEKP